MKFFLIFSLAPSEYSFLKPSSSASFAIAFAIPSTSPYLTINPQPRPFMMSPLPPTSVATVGRLKITVKGFAGYTGQFADLTDGDVGIGRILHQFQQAPFQLPLAEGAFFSVAVLVHGDPHSQKYMDIIADFPQVVNISKLLTTEF